MVLTSGFHQMGEKVADVVRTITNLAPWQAAPSSTEQVDLEPHKVDDTV